MSKTDAVPGAVQEVERKYEAPAEQEVPALDNLPGVAGAPVHDSIQLSATYFDTADYRLLAEKITLRKREGGDDAGWHMKLPGAGDARTEIQLPPDDGTVVPEALSTLVRAIIRGNDLVPVALIITDRERTRLNDADDTLLAEVVSDTVIACKADGSGESTWQEVEVEQGAGGQPLADAIETLLFGAGLERSESPSKLKRALGTSVTPHSAPEATTTKSPTPRILLRNYLIEQIRALTDADLGTRRRSEEAVHDFRVAARRIRSALQSYAGQSPRTDALVDDLRWLGGKFGDARDVEVQWQRLVDRLGEIDMPEQEAVRARIDEYFSARAETAQGIALDTLNSERYLTLLENLDAYVVDLEFDAIGRRTDKKISSKELANTLQHLSHKVGKRVDKVAEATSRADRDEKIHRARKGAKRMKYAIEVMKPSNKHRAKRALKHFNHFQDVLGEHQDSVVAGHHLLEMASEHEHTSLTSFSLGMVYRRELDIADEQAALLEKTWKEAAKSSATLWR
ncbi:UNVERIFIED_ORG: inorganic triphosphatase YgiF [Nocardia globerula]|uniref:Inorganic triphosphatase YgiF n=1 Tax=Nocardia globerula TaxID=1818 RepID=A0A652YUE7_NOCGL|nr:CYTH and CHAD domain-containing protein [Rhodococcus globerulus]NMD60942.1 CYTH and CHAD domain-containing protein [Nocardia globerula]PVX67510.1 inorganic triphosphatase YgiF [Rhodococcus globerulus]